MAAHTRISGPNVGPLVNDQPTGDLARRIEQVVSRPDYFVPYCAFLTVLFLGMPVVAAHVFPAPLPTEMMVMGCFAILLFVAAGVPLKRWSDRRRTARLTYDLSTHTMLERFACACIAGRALTQPEKLWMVQPDGAAPARIPVRCGRADFRQISVNVETWCLSLPGQEMLLLPDCILLWRAERLSAIPYEALVVEAATVRHLEDGTVARDAYVADVEWRFVPGKTEVNDLKRLYVCQYGQLTLSSERGGWRLILQTSNLDAAQTAAHAISELTRQITPPTSAVIPAPVNTGSGALQAALAASTPSIARPPDTAVDALKAAPVEEIAVFCPACGRQNRDASKYCGSCGAGMRELKPGALLLSRFRVESQIGQGAMGALFRVWDTRLEKTWALKEMLASGDTEEGKEEATHRFKTEAQMLSKLDHPGLPRVVDYFSEGGCHYLVMDYVEGENVDEVLRHGNGTPLSEDAVRTLALRILDILEYLHNQEPPILYRGLKPSNVMRTADGRVVLVDFGIARSMQTIGTGTAIGTPGYAPPEQYRGQGEKGSDLYSLAATMHHLLCGREPQVPFLFDPIRQLNPEVTEAMDQILQCALQLDPRRRYESAAQMRLALLWDVTTHEVVRALRAESLPGIHFRQITFAPDGGRLACACDDASVCLVDAETFEETMRLEKHEDQVLSVAFSPDGRLLGSGSVDKTARLWDAVSGEPMQCLCGHQAAVSSLAFAGSGHLLASGPWDLSVRLWRLTLVP